VKTKEIRDETTCILQRLNAEDLAWFVGFVEGNGWFDMEENGPYLKYEFGIEVSIADVQLMYKIKTMLGVGNVIIRHNRKMVRFTISSKRHLMNIIVPIFEQYHMLSRQHCDFVLFRDSLKQSFKLVQRAKATFTTAVVNVAFAQPTDTEKKNGLGLFSKTHCVYNCNQRGSRKNKLPKVPYFDSWLVGFLEAEGCFRKQKEKNSKVQLALVGFKQPQLEVAFFKIKKTQPFCLKQKKESQSDTNGESHTATLTRQQLVSPNLQNPNQVVVSVRPQVGIKLLCRCCNCNYDCGSSGMEIIQAIRQRLNIKSQPYIDETNSVCLQTTSKRGVSNVIRFLTNCKAKLKGAKRLEFLQWLHHLRQNQRYASLQIPIHY